MPEIIASISDGYGKIVAAGITAAIECVPLGSGRFEWRGQLACPMILPLEFGPYQLVADNGRSGEIQIEDSGGTGLAWFVINGSFR